MRSPAAPGLFVAALLLATVGCRPLIEPWWDLSTLRAAKTDRADLAAGAVYLRARTERTFNLSADEDFNYVVLRRHFLLKVLSRSGLRRASTIRIPFAVDAELLDLSARVVGRGDAPRALKPRPIHHRPRKIEKEDVRWLAFSIPGVAVGDVVEVKLTVRRPRLYGGYVSELGGELPVRDHQLVYRIRGGALTYRLKAYNTTQKWLVHQTGDNRMLSLRLKDLRPVGAEPWSPPHRAFLPYAAFSVRRAYFGVHGFDIFETWNDAMARAFAWLVVRAGELESGFSPIGPHARASGPISERIARALTWVRDRLATEGGTADALDETTRPRPFRRVVAAKRATPFEKAALLRSLLRRHGLRSTLALYRSSRRGPLDRDLPLPEQMSSALVRLPVQDGVAKALWLAPACGNCALGQVPHEATGQPALLLASREQATPPKPAVRFETIEAETPPPCSLRRDSRLEIAPDGNVAGRTTLTVEGACSRWDLWAITDEAKLKQRLARELRPRVPGLELTAAVARSRSKGRQPRSITARWRSSELVARGNDGALRVPLGLLASPLSGLFMAKTRRNPIWLAAPRRFVQRVEIVAPDGARVVVPDDVGGPTTHALGAHRAAVSDVEGGAAIESTLSLVPGSCPASAYPAFRRLVTASDRVARRAAIVVRNSAPGGTRSAPE